jgi:catechol 2,3-dioxygenase-like lactoylglutathione lyase family enzyme
MIEIEQIHHVSLAVRDLSRAKEFYSGVLQFSEIERPPFGSRGIWYAIGDRQLHLSENSEAETLRASGIDDREGHFAIWVKSYKSTIDWLQKQGIAYKTKPDSIAGFSQIWIIDPDHNVIEFDAEFNS